MSNCRFLVFLVVCCLLSVPLIGQQTTLSSAQRDPQAMAILRQVLDAAGGPAALGAIQDFTATGTIIFYWAGEEVQGSVTVRGRGAGQFRLDANLPVGVFSMAVDNSAGTVKDIDGTVRSIPFSNTVNSGSRTLPFAYLVAALRDPSTSVSYLGLETSGDQQVHHIRLRQVFAAGTDPDGMRSKLATRDFLIDPTTFYVLATRDMVHPQGNVLEDHPHEVRFSDYRSVNGVAVPFSITETGDGLRLFTIQLEQVSFNTGLGDPDFQE